MHPTARRLVRGVSSRTYSDALDRLGEIASNRRTTHLFDRTGGGGADINAVALPEMRAWLRRAGYAPDDLARMRHIHVAGTKGKGSVCAHATAMLLSAGAGAGGRVGTYTSPHLVSPRERIAIDGEPVPRDVFARGFFELWDRFAEAAIRDEGLSADQAGGHLARPFFFRYMTILAWHIFLTQGIGSVVMECGIGGEHDSTNVLPAAAVSAAVVTQLGIDHVAMLGDTVEQIAWHKAGIFKPGVRAFTRRLDDRPLVMQVLRARAAEVGASLVEVTDDQVERWGGVAGGGLKGDFQKYNQALAVMAVREHLGLPSDDPGAALSDAGMPDALAAGLRRAKLRGRCEVLEARGAAWHLDGAHTKDSLEQVARWFAQALGPSQEDHPPAVLVFNQQERNAPELLAGFLDALRRVTGRPDAGGIFELAIFTRNDVTRPASGEARDLGVQRDTAAVMRSMAPGCRVLTRDNIPDAVEEALKVAGRGHGSRKILVTGSLHLVGGIMQTLEPDSAL